VPRLELVDPAEFTVTLEVDALYLTSARMALRRTSRSKRTRDLANRLERMQRSLEKVDPWADYDEVEALAIEMEAVHSALFDAYTPSLRYCAHTILFSALAVEAHANRRIREILTGRQRSNLLRAGFVNKVQGLLKAAARTSFRDGSKELRRLGRLARRRHALVHYRSLPLPAGDMRNLPQFPADLPLSPRAAQASFLSAVSILASLNQLLKLEAPYWLSGEAWGFFAWVTPLPARTAASSPRPPGKGH